ncbi:unnamed protein product [Hermetia illucens]|uniref:Glycolipid transfer protein domain-containing protein n=1 Tax=Hermetia illucens TaxID=343691 RepID=A0A7R8YY88_HERIL|nr:glycolipid transfer protein [Hermetia illucens]CAD7090203.1 unnamed protein product [Hermetia illucens]
MSEAELPRIVMRKYTGFPQLEDECTTAVETLHLLDAAKEVVQAIESFGTLFSPVVNDMRNNIQKITTVYSKNPEKYRNLDELLRDEKSQQSIYAANALLWLKRALELISVFFYNIVNDKEEKNELKEALRDAYDKTLKPYHGWIVQNAFALVYRWVPTRQQLFGTGDVYIENMTLLLTFQKRMHSYLVAITTLIVTHDLDDKTAV